METNIIKKVSSFISEEAKGRLSSDFSHSSLSDMSCLQHIAQGQPQQDWSRVYLRCLSGEIAATSAPATEICPLSVSEKPWWYHHHGNQCLEGPKDYSGLAHLGQTGPSCWSGYLLPLLWPSKPSRNHPERERIRKTLNTEGTSLSKRRSTLPNRCGTDLQPENSLEAFQES